MVGIDADAILINKRMSEGIILYTALVGHKPEKIAMSKENFDILSASMVKMFGFEPDKNNAEYDGVRIEIQEPEENECI